MKLKDQVTSLKLSKKLKELGVEQDSLFYWVGTDLVGWKIMDSGVAKVTSKKAYLIISAFTSAELGKRLLDWTVTTFDKEGITIIGTDGKKPTPFINAKTEANVRGKMLAYLMENDLIKMIDTAQEAVRRS